MRAIGNRIFPIVCVALAGHLALSRTCQGKDLPVVSPDSVTLSQEKLGAIHGVLQSYLTSGKAPGFVVMIAKDGKPIYRDAVGTRDIVTGAPMTLDTLFWIASMTKPITSVAVLQLYDQGKIKLEDPVSKYIPQMKGMKVYKGEGLDGPEFEAATHEITIYELLTHTAGLAYNGWIGADSDYVDRQYAHAQLVFSPDGNPGSRTLEEMVSKLGRLPLRHQPGEVWRYSIANDVQAYLVQTVSGERFDKYVKRHILDPLEMKDTGFFVPKDKWALLATIYDPANPEFTANSIRRKFLSPPTFYSGGHGLVSTAGDYLRFAQMLANGGELDHRRILESETVKLMTTSHVKISAVDCFMSQDATDAGCGWGYGVAIIADSAAARLYGDGYVGEFFWGGTANTKFWVDPKNNIAGVIMTQVLSDPLPVRNEVKRIVYQTLVK